MVRQEKEREKETETSHARTALFIVRSHDNACLTLDSVPLDFTDGQLIGRDFVCFRFDLSFTLLRPSRTIVSFSPHGVNLATSRSL